MAAGNTYEAIATQTLGSAAASVTFSSIPSTYTDLVLVSAGALTADGWVPALQFNSDTGSNYSTTLLEGSGSTAISERISNRVEIFAGYSYAGWGTTVDENNLIFHIQNYANTTTYKTVLGRNNVASGATSSYPGTAATVSLWRSTSAINSITFKVGGAGTTIKAGTIVSLYGIKSA